MHIGKTTGEDTKRPMLVLEESRGDGARSSDQLVVGTYVHGIFSDDDFRTEFLSRFRTSKVIRITYDVMVESALDQLARHLEKNLHIDQLKSTSSL